VTSSEDPAVGDDGTSAEVESAAVLQGHLPGDLTSSSWAATDNSGASLEDLWAAEFADTTCSKIKKKNVTHRIQQSYAVILNIKTLLKIIFNLKQTHRG